MAAALVLGLLAAEPASAKVYKMNPEERAAALKEKRAKRSKAKKSGKPVPGQDQGGWVEVKPGEKPAKKNRKSKVDEIAQTAEQKGKKSKKGKKDAAEVERPEKKSKKEAAEVERPEKKGKKSKKDAAEAVAEKPAKKSKKGKKDAEEIVVEKKGRKSKAEKRAEKDEAASAERTTKKSGRKSRHSASQGDRAVGHDYSGERKISASSAEVRRPAGSVPAPAAAPAGQADDLSTYSVSRPGQDKAVVPEVRQEVQPGPIDTAKPVGTERKAGEGRF
jgi:hypothetical protein